MSGEPGLEIYHLSCNPEGPAAAPRIAADAFLLTAPKTLW